MHELSIAEALVEAVQQELRDHPDAQVRLVRVRVGALRLVVPEALQACYAAASRHTALAGSALVIEPVPATAGCATCGTIFRVDEAWFECPDCGACGAALRTGRELELTGIEMEQATALSRR